jgi:hypothetical protein
MVCECVEAGGLTESWSAGKNGQRDFLVENVQK